jgi:hypothetical protein
MKKNRKISFALIALLLSVIGLLMFFTSRPINRPSAPLESADRPVSNGERQNRTIDPVLATKKIKNDYEHREKLKALTRQPIAYFGLTVDEMGVPIPGVTIAFDVNVGLGEPPLSGSVTSDPMGRFTIVGHTGKQLSIHPRKDGYRNASTNGGGKFSLMNPQETRYQGSLSNPSIVRLWKLKGVDDLVRIDREFRVQLGVPVDIDLTNARVVNAGGDLRIDISRDPGAADRPDIFSWTYSISPISGRIHVTDEIEWRTRLAAPNEHYLPSIVRRFQPDDVAWKSNDYLWCYLEARDRAVWAKLHISVRVDRTGEIATVHIFGLVNRSGLPTFEE